MGYYVCMDMLEKIKKIEALIASSKSEGEKNAATLAKNRILERHKQEPVEKPLEYTIHLRNEWKKKLFVALCNKFQIQAYRYKRQKSTTVMLRADPTFVNNTLWPEFNKYAALLEDLVQDIINDLINKIHDVKEEEIVIAGELPETP